MASHQGDRIIFRPHGGVVEYMLSDRSGEYTRMLGTLRSRYDQDPRILSDTETPFKKAYEAYEKSLEEGINCFDKYAGGKVPKRGLFEIERWRKEDEMSKIAAVNVASSVFNEFHDADSLDAGVEATTRKAGKRNKPVSKSKKRKKTRKRKKPVSKSKKRNKSKRKKR